MLLASSAKITMINNSPEAIAKEWYFFPYYIKSVNT